MFLEWWGVVRATLRSIKFNHYMHVVVTQAFQRTVQARLGLSHTPAQKTNYTMGHVAEVKDMPERFCGSCDVYPNMQWTVEVFVIIGADKTVIMIGINFY